MGDLVIENRGKRVFTSIKRQKTSRKQNKSCKTVKSINDKIILSKKDYNLILKEKRKEFLDFFISKELRLIFSLLTQDANNIKECNLNIEIKIPIHLNIEKIEQTLKIFFQNDLGFFVETKINKENHFIILNLM
jgi:hypothetical protein